MSEISGFIISFQAMESKNKDLTKNPEAFQASGFCRYQGMRESNSR